MKPVQLETLQTPLKLLFLPVRLHREIPAMCHPLKVPKDGGVEWTNKDNVPHTVTSLIDDGKTFDSKPIKPNATFILDAMTLKEKQYDYFCTLHPYMKGKITVG